MIRNGEISMSEVKRILRKYWWILPLTIVSGGALGLGATMVLPKKFTSQSRVQIHEQSVSQDLVKPVLTEATNARLASMQEQILSRTQLQAIIERLGLYPSDRGKFHMEDLVLRLRKAIEVTPADSSLAGQSPAAAGLLHQRDVRQSGNRPTRLQRNHQQVHGTERQIHERKDQADGGFPGPASE